ncbi:MAG TPA: ATP-binding protein [Ignisphaera sp.]|nr:ATP-binding protein [Ignisphaera sp.]
MAIQSTLPELVGYIVGESRPYRAEVLAFRPLMLGEYLYLEYHGYRVLAMVSSTLTGSSVITSNLVDPRDVERLIKHIRSGERIFYHRGTIKILGHISNGSKLSIPPIPPPPGTEVFKAPKTILNKVFRPSSSEYIRIGSLLRDLDVEVRVNLNKIVSRHLAILAMTGMGKSNLVALIAKRVAELGGTIVVFDYHGEYTSLKLKTSVVNVIEPKVNPLSMNLEEIARLFNIKKNASRQRMVLFECFEQIKSMNKKGFFDNLKKCLQSRVARYGVPAQKVLESVIAYEGFLKKILDEDIPDVIDRIGIGAINVVDLSELHIHQADAVVSHWLHRILDARKEAVWSRGKKGLVVPIITVIEEAHAFIPSDEETATKRSAESIAREGRKFGVGLIIVSQRPRGLDPNILSQMGNLAVLRIVHPEDQSYIAKHCEPITQDIIEELPGLNVGEAILLGEWVLVPTVAKIDLVVEKSLGMDINAVELWRKVLG